MLVLVTLIMIVMLVFLLTVSMGFKGLIKLLVITDMLRETKDERQ